VVELAVLALLTLIVLMAVVRPLVRRVLTADPVAIGLVAGPAMAGDGAVDAMMVPRENTTAKLVDFAQLNGKVQAETVQRVVDMVRASPAETVEVLRNWIHDN
jgi:flagellar M-ring protein FliF